MLKEKRASKLIGSVLAFATLMPMAMSQADVRRSATSARQVMDAMAQAGIAVRPDQIDLLSGISGARESSSVRVVSVTDRTAGTAKVKLRCQDNQECLPFYVLVHGLNGVRVSSTRTPSVPVVQASSVQNIVRGGDHATLILESADSRMSLPVICLQSGVRGQKIRVASPDHRQFFDAEIVATGVLKGSL